MIVPIPCMKNSEDADLFYAPVFEVVMMEQGWILAQLDSEFCSLVQLFLYGARDGTQSLPHTRQVLYHRSQTPDHFTKL